MGKRGKSVKKHPWWILTLYDWSTNIFSTEVQSHIQLSATLAFCISSGAVDITYMWVWSNCYQTVCAEHFVPWDGSPTNSKIYLLYTVVPSSSPEFNGEIGLSPRQSPRPFPEGVDEGLTETGDSIATWSLRAQALILARFAQSRNSRFFIHESLAIHDQTCSLLNRCRDITSIRSTMTSEGIWVLYFQDEPDMQESLSTNQRVVEKGGKMRQQCGHWQSKQERASLSILYSVKYTQWSSKVHTRSIYFIIGKLMPRFNACWSEAIT